MNTVTFVVVAAVILLFGLVSGRAERTAITPPIVFVALGFLVSPSVLDWVRLDVGEGAIHALAELTLILVLFTDAARIDLRMLRREHNVPVRLLSISLPLTIAAGTLVGMVLLKGLHFWEVALVAAILAPTDAALGQAVVSNPSIPVRIRQALNVESGLNDGIALPVILIFVSLTGAAMEMETSGYWARFVSLQLILGPLIGVLIGFCGGRIVSIATRRSWMNRTFQHLASIGLSVLAFGIAEMVGGNGFIATFCAGLTLGNTSRPICECLYEFGEAEGQLLTLIVFMVFGNQIVPEVLEHANASIVLYALLSLTLVRMVPTAIGLLGSGLRPVSLAFLGWFGPRGLASILFALLVVEEVELPGGEHITVLVMTTVLLSVFLHGFTAYPLGTAYGKRLAAAHPERHTEEHRNVSTMPLRLPARS